MIEFGANAIVPPFCQKWVSFGLLFMTEEIKYASICVRLLSMIVTVNSLAARGDTALYIVDLLGANTTLLEWPFA